MEAENQDKLIRDEVRLEMKKSQTRKEFPGLDGQTAGADLVTEATPQKDLNPTPGDDLSFNVMKTPGDSPEPLRRGQNCCHKFSRLNLRISVPVRGQISLRQALVSLIANVLVPGLGTALLACYISDKQYRLTAHGLTPKPG